MNNAQNGNIFGLPNNNAINNQNTNFNQNFMNQNMMMGNQNMMMGNMNMMNMMMNNPNMMMTFLNMMMGIQNLMMGDQNYFNSQNNNMGSNNMSNKNGINMNNTSINSNFINEDNKKDDIYIYDKEEILPRNEEVISEDNKPDGDIIFLRFKLSTGSSIIIYVNRNSTFKEAVKKFCQKINLNEKYLENRIIFLYDACRINFDSYTTLKDLNFYRNHSITVYDNGNAIGT
jgi:hypothetical protein